LVNEITGDFPSLNMTFLRGQDDFHPLTEYSNREAKDSVSLFCRLLIDQAVTPLNNCDAQRKAKSEIWMNSYRIIWTAAPLNILQCAFALAFIVLCVAVVCRSA
jgi:hypothetical protein